MNTKNFVGMKVLLIFMFLLLAFSPDGSASRIIPMSDSALAADADVILIGEVLSLTSEWNDAEDLMFTYVEIQVDSVIMGPTTDSIITLRLWGGSDDDYTMMLDGGPTFEVEETVLLYLESDFTSLFPIIGFNQGKFTIRTDPQSGETILEGENEITPMEQHLSRLKDFLEVLKEVRDE